MPTAQRSNRFVSIAPRALLLTAFSVIAALCIGEAAAQTSRDVPHISDIRLFRKLGEYERALAYLNIIMVDKKTPDDIRRRAYAELVTVFYLTEGVDSARSLAEDALAEFHDLEAEPAHHPDEVRELYDELRNIMFGRLRLASEPRTCEVYLGEERIGMTPLEGIYVPIGGHTLRISAFGYEDRLLDVDIKPGGELEHIVKLRPYRAEAALGIGFEAGLSIVSLDYDGAGGVFAGAGTVAKSTNAARFGAGVSLHMYRRDRLAVQAGVRYISHGNRVYFQSGTGTSALYDSYFRYLAVPVLVRYYLIKNPRIFLCAGPEFALLLSAELSRAENGEPLDVMDYTQAGQVSLTFGAGYEIGIAGQYIMISAYRTMGLLSIRKSAIWNLIDYKPREWKFAIGLIFNI